MKYYNGASLASICGVALLGCWGSDYKIGDVIRDDVRVESVPRQEPASLGLPACRATTEIELYASLQGPFDCDGAPCFPDPGTQATWPGTSAIGVTYDGSNVVLFALVSDDAEASSYSTYYGTVLPGRVGRLRRLTAGAVTWDHNLVVGADESSSEAARFSRVFRLEPDGAKAVATVPGAVRSISSRADGFAIEGHDSVFDGNAWHEFDWISRHDGVGATLWRTVSDGTPIFREIALGGQGTLFEYRYDVSAASTLARYDGAGAALGLVTLPSSYRQAIVAGPEDQLVVAVSKQARGAAVGFGVYGYGSTGNESWSFDGLLPVAREPVRAIFAENGEAYVASSFQVQGSTRGAVAVLRFSPAGEACLAGSWSFEGNFDGVVGLAETPDGIVVATPHWIGTMPKR